MGFAEGLNQMSMNDSEMALFSAAVLLSPDRPVINDAKGIAQYQERITDALRLQVRPSSALFLLMASISILLHHLFFLLFSFEFLSCWEITPATRAWSTPFFRRLSSWGPLATDISRSWTGTVAAGVCSFTCPRSSPKCLTSPAARKIWLENHETVSRFFSLLSIFQRNF